MAENMTKKAYFALKFHWNIQILTLRLTVNIYQTFTLCQRNAVKKSTQFQFLSQILFLWTLIPMKFSKITPII